MRAGREGRGRAHLAGTPGAGASPTYGGRGPRHPGLPAPRQVADRSGRARAGGRRTRPSSPPSRRRAAAVLERIAAACARVGRDPADGDARGRLQDGRGRAPPRGRRGRPDDPRREPRPGGRGQGRRSCRAPSGTSSATSRRNKAARAVELFDVDPVGRLGRSWPARLDRHRRGERRDTVAGAALPGLPAGQRRRRPGQGGLRARRAAGALPAIAGAADTSTSAA